MSYLKKLRFIGHAMACIVSLASIAVAVDSPAPTPVEPVALWWPKGQGGGLGTVEYQPSELEKPFFERLAEDELVTGSHFNDYKIADKDKKFVGWFGIVRKIAADENKHQTLLTVEHKYFDGLTDAHLQTVSFNGSGDFRVVLAGTDHRIPPLSLVKLYGTVTQAETSLQLDAVYVRNWHWGTFTFLAAYGTQHGSEKWRKLNQIELDGIYESWPHPSHHYYENRLGKRPDRPQILKNLIDAAEPLSEEMRPVMERLAALIVVGHTWSRGETMRQSSEMSQLRELVESTNSREASLHLLLQSLQENDERVSWSGSAKFAMLDPDGAAIDRLVQLLSDEDDRVKAGAARALSLGYGAKASPATDALARCVDAAEPDLREFAIRALAEIGPEARSAVPELKKLLNHKSLDTRVNAAQTLWKINRVTDDVVIVFIDVLENGNESERGNSLRQLKLMGPSAVAAIPTLIDTLKDEYWGNRSHAVEVIGAIGPAAKAAIPALTNSLQTDVNSYVRSYAAEALGQIGNHEAIPILIKALQDEDDYVRWKATDALVTFGEDASAAVPALIELIKGEGNHRWNAANAVGAIDAEGTSVPTLIEALNDRDTRLRRYAAYGLAKMGKRATAAEQPLLVGMRDSDLGVRIAATEAYWSVSGNSEEPVRVLRSVIRSTRNWNEKMWAANALAKIGPQASAAVPELIECLTSQSRETSSSAVQALGSIGPGAKAALPALSTKIQDEKNQGRRIRLARTLWQIDRSEQTLPILRHALENPEYFGTLAQVAKAAGEMGSAAAELVPLLRPLLKHPESIVREEVAKAIEQITDK